MRVLLLILAVLMLSVPAHADWIKVLEIPFSSDANATTGDQPSFTRAGGKWFVNSTGDLENAAENEVAIDWTNGYPGALFERGATNLNSYSHDMSNWNSYQISAQTDGETFAGHPSNRIVMDENAEYLRRTMIPSSGDYFISFWVKNIDADKLHIEVFDGIDHIGNEDILPEIGSDIFYHVKKSYSTSGSGKFHLPRNYENGRGSFLATAVQSELYYHTSYIETNGTSASRVSDKATTPGNSGFFVDILDEDYLDEGSLSFKWTPAYGYAQNSTHNASIVALDDSMTTGIWTDGDGNICFDHGSGAGLCADVDFAAYSEYQISATWHENGTRELIVNNATGDWSVSDNGFTGLDNSTLALGYDTIEAWWIRDLLLYEGANVEPQPDKKIMMRELGFRSLKSLPCPSDSLSDRLRTSN